jgi:hypothetical protein
METHELSGYYTYRSLINQPLAVNDFNKIKLEEAELFLIIQYDGNIIGTLSFPPDIGAVEKKFMDITGKIKSWSSPITLEFTSQGRKNTELFDIKYEHFCLVSPKWEKSIGQSLSLNGTVIQYENQTSGEQTAKTSETASFIAVKREFIEPRDIQGVAIIPSAISMLASRSHRLKHTVWHTLRLSGLWDGLDEERKNKIRNLGWGLNRPPYINDGNLNLTNGAGEDFLFMHRKMIAMVRDEYAAQKIPYIESWKIIPPPEAQQFTYKEENDPLNSDKKIYRFNILESGYMIPSVYFIAGDRQQDFESLKFLKSSNYFRLVMTHLESLFKNPRYLVTLSLGALGNLLEFTIHNQMHMRWSSTPRDPVTGEPARRALFDVNIKWDSPQYDYLGDFYSSHVNPIFWKLHGWVDDRIEDWFNAHETAHPGEIERYRYEGVFWFKPGKWVQVSNPFYGPELHHHPHHNHANEEELIENMLKVLEIINGSEIAKSRISFDKQGFGFVTFLTDIESPQ